MGTTAVPTIPVETSDLPVSAKAARGDVASVPLPAAPDLLTAAMLLAVPPHQRVTGCALVVRCDVATDRAGRPYLALTLRGADGGHIEARWWRYPHPVEQRPATGQVYWLRGDLDTYHGERQLRLVEARPAPGVQDCFVRATRRSVEDLQAELAATVAALPPDLAALVGAVLSGERYERFCTWPAAQHKHGAVRHGLLAHSLRVARLAQAIAAAYGPDGLPCDLDLVTAACLLHDVGKVYCLPAVAGAPAPEEALQHDHVTRGVLLVQAAATTPLDPGIAPARLDHLTHALLAHHGRKEWGAPVEPQTVEAWLVHLADLAEAQLWHWSREEQP